MCSRSWIGLISLGIGDGTTLIFSTGFFPLMGSPTDCGIFYTHVVLQFCVARATTQTIGDKVINKYLIGMHRMFGLTERCHRLLHLQAMAVHALENLAQASEEAALEIQPLVSACPPRTPI